MGTHLEPFQIFMRPFTNARDPAPPTSASVEGNWLSLVAKYVPATANPEAGAVWPIPIAVPVELMSRRKNAGPTMVVAETLICLSVSVTVNVYELAISLLANVF